MNSWLAITGRVSFSACISSMPESREWLSSTAFLVQRFRHSPQRTPL
ncbi:hypothetical protein X793_04770 [Dehalococcoides mccartyi CG4]|nr:hypothetical protein X793_04770 [Dehalococcoides mccartyi CG4]